MNKYQKIINQIAKIEYEDQLDAGFNAISFKEMRIYVREEHNKDPYEKLKAFKRFLKGERF